MQYLIVYTANRDILKNGEWTTNGATPPLNVSYKFGFGVLDAEAMVTRAKHWINVPEQQSDTVQFTPSTGCVRDAYYPFVIGLQHNVTHSMWE